jgi:hypothetical protein
MVRAAMMLRIFIGYFPVFQRLFYQGRWMKEDMDAKNPIAIAKELLLG